MNFETQKKIWKILAVFYIFWNSFCTLWIFFWEYLISPFFFFFLIYRLMFAIIWNILLSLCNVKMAKHRQCFLIQNRHRVKNPVSPRNLNTGLTKDGKALIWTLPYTTIFTFFKYVHLEKLWCMPFRSPDIGTLVPISVVNIQENYCLKA